MILVQKTLVQNMLDQMALLQMTNIRVMVNCTLISYRRQPKRRRWLKS